MTDQSNLETKQMSSSTVGQSGIDAQTTLLPEPPRPPLNPVPPPLTPTPVPTLPPSSVNPAIAKPPGWQFQSGNPITPADWRKVVDSRVIDESTWYRGPSHANFASNTVQGAPSIVELARSLKNDPQLIFEFVYENIEWEPGFALQKGSLGCLLDGLGNSFDQSALLVALLRQAGFVANYVLGKIQLSEAQYNAWFNTTSIWAAYNYCGNENIPAQSPTWNGSIYQMVISHCWVQVVVSGTTYVLDPSLKTYTRKAPLANLGTVLGYNAATFLADAESGATIDSSGNYVQSMNSANIRADLKTMTSNLVTYIKNNAIGSAPAGTATIDDVLGGQAIVPLTLPFTWQTSLSYEAPGDVPTIWTGDVPSTYKTTLQVQFPDNSGGWCIDQTFTSDQLAGARLTLFFNSSLQPVLALNGVTVATGIAQGAGTWNSVRLTVTHNGYPVTWYNQQWWQSFIWAGRYYLIGNAWGNLGRGQALFHTTQLNANRAAGGLESSEPVLGEQLAVIWFNWAAQASRVTDVVNRLTNCHTMFNHQVGVVSFNSGGAGAFATDIGGVSGSSTNLNNDTTKTPINDTVNAMHGVALEAATLAQTTGLVPGISTTTVIDAANTAGNKIYKGTASNWNTGTNISAALVANGYNSADMTNIYNWYISAGDSVVIGDHPSQTLGAWAGWADWIYPSSGAFGLISGAYKGGGGQPGSAQQPPASNPNPGNNPAGQVNNNDPIGVFSGDFFYSRTDISVGSQEYPYSLEFTRNYNSGDRYSNGVLGWGWTHNFATNARVSSDGFLALAEQFAIQGASSIAEMFVCVDIFSDTNRPIPKLVTVSLANRWWLDQLVSNVVILSFSEGKHTFVKQPDGSFTSPATFPGTLTLAGGLFTFTTPDGTKLNFNSSGQIATKVFPQGVTITYNYVAGLLSTVSNGLGRTLTFNYTGGLLTGVSDGTGRSISFAYDGSGNLATFTNALSKSYSYSYDQPGRMIQYFAPANPGTAYCTNVYDSLGRVKSQSNARSQQWTYYFAGPRTEINDPLGNKEILYFNRLGGVLRHIDALGFQSVNVFDGLNRIVSKTFPEGNQWQWTYDKNNNILTKTMVPKAGSGLSNIQLVWTYDSVWAKMKTATDGRGNVTTYNYDPTQSVLLSTLKPMIGGVAPTITRTYNARGQLLTSTDETGIVTKYSYDSTTEKLLSKVVDYGTGGTHLNLTTSYGFDAVGNFSSVTDPNGNTSSFQFDAERRLTQRTDPAPFSFLTKWGYDFNGNLTTIQRQITSTPAWQLAQIAYTVTGKKYTVTDPLGYVTTYAYDGKDRPQSVTDPESRVYQFSFDALDRLSIVTDPTNTASDSRTYTNNGLLKTRTDARSKTTQYSYDGHDRLDKTTYADGTFERNSTYDANGNVLLYQTRSGNTITQTYDVLNRLATRSPTGQPTVTNSYDRAGRLIQSSKPVVAGDPSSGAVQFFFDTAGRYYKEQYPDSKTVVHILDSNGNKTKTTWPDGYYVSRVFDQLNRMTDVKLNGSATSAVQITFDQLSRRATVTLSNGVVTTYGFHDNNDLVSISHAYVGSSVSFSYGYNHAHQLTSNNVSDGNYLWHPVGALTSTYGVADSVNSYPSVAGAAYSYDGNKNLAGDGTWAFSYDTENHLLSASKTGLSATYVYDPIHRQAQKTVGSVKTRFIYDGNQRIADYDGTSGNLVTRYVNVGVDEPMIQVTSTGVVSFFHQDKQNSVIAVTDSTGAVVNHYAYSSFGESTILSGTTFGYTGQRYDAETGLYYYKARYYSPVLGRFLQPDPIGYEGGLTLNLYEYVNNDPLNHVDSLGLTSQPTDGGDGGDGGDTGGDTPPPPDGVPPEDPPPEDPLPPDGKDPNDRGDENSGTNEERIRLEKLWNDFQNMIRDIITGGGQLA